MTVPTFKLQLKRTVPTFSVIVRTVPTFSIIIGTVPTFSVVVGTVPTQCSLNV